MLRNVQFGFRPSASLIAIGAFAAAATLGLGLAACSGDDDDTVVTKTTTDGGADSSVQPVVDSGVPTTGTDASEADDTGVTTTPDAAAPATVATNVLYVESNDPTSGKNAIFGYARAADGSLTPLAGSPYPTGGTGVSNPMQALGPDDTDYQIVASPDHTRLFAVNAGSDTIAVFDIAGDGSLTAVSGSPFASGGLDPVSLAVVGSSLLVVNQDQDPARSQTSTAGNYTALTIGSDGTLTSASGVTPIAAGKSPQMILPTPDGTEAFGIDFMAASSIRSFTLAANGQLTKSSTDPLALPATLADGGTAGPPPALGLALNPNNPVLYVGYVLRGQIGVYTYDANAALTYVGTGAVTGMAPCWIRSSKDGKFLYITDTLQNEMSVMSVSTDGKTIAQIQKMQLDDPGPSYDAGGMPGASSETYDEELSPDGKFLYVISERTTTDTTVTDGNTIHVLAIDPTAGTLTETAPDVKLNPDAGVPITARTQGLVVF